MNAGGNGSFAHRGIPSRAPHRAAAKSEAADSNPSYGSGLTMSVYRSSPSLLRFFLRPLAQRTQKAISSAGEWADSISIPQNLTGEIPKATALIYQLQSMGSRKKAR
jgi:hypothetical protein